MKEIRTYIEIFVEKDSIIFLDTVKVRIKKDANI